VTVLEPEPGLDQLGRSGELENLDVLGVVDRQSMRQELIDSGNEAEHFAKTALTFLLQVAELCTV
jgi:hypothetical protein